MHSLTRLSLAAAFCTVLSASLAGQGQTKPLDPVNMDTTCVACRNFFTYANGGWLQRTAIPGDRPVWGSFDELQENTQNTLHDLLTEAARNAATARDPDQRKLGLFYSTCMDSTGIERAGLRPLKTELGRIAAIRSRRDIQTELARLQRQQVDAAFAFRSTPDPKQTTRTIAEIYQAGLGMPDREYYLKTDSASEALKQEYLTHVATMLRLAGEDRTTSVRSAASIMAMETALAKASMTKEAQRDPEAVYHLTTSVDLQRSAPAVTWDDYYAALQISAPQQLNIGQPQFVHAFDSLLASASIENWKKYLRWRLLQTAAPALSSPFVQEDFQFNWTVLQGVKEMRPRWKRCLAMTDASMGEILGQAFVRTYFTPEAKARALDMVRNIRAEFRERLRELPWMSEATKAKAYRKLSAIVNKIGYPDRWRNYSALEVKSDAFVLNLLRANTFETNRDFAKIDKPTDRTDWGMTPPTVDAYYNAYFNEIVFPAGIMQPPFFDPKADDAVNYGGMGGVIGHEITHGFDDEGRQFDAQGNLSGWWDSTDTKEFNRRAGMLVTQAGGFVAVDTLRVNGKLTLGENIADLGGVLIAYGAYRRSLQGKPEPAPIDGFTGDQRFFLAWAQIWRSKFRPEYARMLVTLDPHAPRAFRASAPLSNIPAFARAFGCKAGDPMVRPESERAQIW